MSKALDEAEEDLRQLGWEVRILRDQVLRLSELLPPTGRDRLNEISARMTAASDTLRTGFTRDEAESEARALQHLRDGIQEIRKELNLVVKDLRDFADGFASPQEPAGEG